MARPKLTWLNDTVRYAQKNEMGRFPDIQDYWDEVAADYPEDGPCIVTYEWINDGVAARWAAFIDGDAAGPVVYCKACDWFDLAISDDWYEDKCPHCGKYAGK